MLNKSYGWIHWFGEYQQFHNVWTRFNIHWKVNAFWREDYVYITLKDCIHTIVGADCTVTAVALLVVASTIFKAFLKLLSSLPFKFNWLKRHLFNVASLMLSRFFKLSGLLSNLFFAEIYLSLGRYLNNKVTSPDCDEDCCERFFWDSHWYTL